MSIASGGRLDAQHLGAHGGDRAGDLVDGLAAHPQRHQEAAHLRRRRFARHHAVEGVRGFVAREHGAGRDLGDERLELVGHAIAPQCSLPRQHGPSRAFQRGGEIEEILQDQMAVLGGDAFRMELHAVHRQRSMCAAP